LVGGDEPAERAAARRGERALEAHLEAGHVAGAHAGARCLRGGAAARDRERGAQGERGEAAHRAPPPGTSRSRIGIGGGLGGSSERSASGGSGSSPSSAISTARDGSTATGRTGAPWGSTSS